MKPMSQKFSELNKDYAKSMAWRDDVVLKRSTRRGLVSFLLGLFIVLAVLVVFFSFKRSLFTRIQQKIDKVSVVAPEKSKPLKKHVKAKVPSESEQEYGFYTMLPNVEVKSARHEEPTDLESSH